MNECERVTVCDDRWLIESRDGNPWTIESLKCKQMNGVTSGAGTGGSSDRHRGPGHTDMEQMTHVIFSGALVSPNLHHVETSKHQHIKTST